MKTLKIMKNLSTIIIILIAVAISINTSAQDKAKKEIRLKMVKEDNGNVTKIDTTISISANFSEAELQELKDLLGSDDFKNLGIDMDNLTDLNNVYFYDVDGTEGGGMVTVTEDVSFDGSGEQSVQVFISTDGEGSEGETVNWISNGDGESYFFSDDGDSALVEHFGDKVIFVKSKGESDGSHTFTFSDEMVWTGSGSTQVEVESTDDGHYIKLTRENGTIEEYTVEEPGSYVIDEDGNITKIEVDGELNWNEKGGENLVWISLSDGGENSNIVVNHVSEDGAEISIEGKSKQFVITSEEDIDTDGENVFIRKYEVKDGEKVMVIENHVVISKLNENDAESLEKSGVPMDENAETLEIDDLSFNPNPNNGLFTLAFTTPDKGNTLVEIFDINGKKVYTENIKNFNGRYEHEIDISHEKKGVYFLKIQQNEKVSTRKIVLE